MMATPPEASGSRPKTAEDPSALLERLHLEEDELDNLVWEEEVEEPEEKPKWLVLARVPTNKSFGQGALIADMKAAWNPARDVVWRRINPNLFSVQFNCLADWNKAIHQGPWDFKGMALIIAEYDGFKNPESIKLDKIETWCQIHKLPDMVLKREKFLTNMAQRIREVQEVQVVLPSGFIGEFIRIRVKLDVNKKLTRFVSFTKSGETEFYQVKFEKLPVFCYMCGMLGHWHEECGSGEHTEKDMEWGPFILAARRGRGGRTRGSGRGFGRSSGSVHEHDGEDDDSYGRGKGAGRGRARGRGYGNDGMTYAGYDHHVDFDQNLQKSWRFNAVNALYDPGVELVSRTGDGRELQMQDANVLGKRSADNSMPIVAGAVLSLENNKGAVVPVGNTTDLVEQFEVSDHTNFFVMGTPQETSIGGGAGTPQENANKKKLKGSDGLAIDSNSLDGSAASSAEDCRGQ